MTQKHGDRHSEYRTRTEMMGMTLTRRGIFEAPELAIIVAGKSYVFFSSLSEMVQLRGEREAVEDWVATLRRDQNATVTGLPKYMYNI